MQREYIQYIITEIKTAIDELVDMGIEVSYPECVELEHCGVKVILPWVKLPLGTSPMQR